MIPGKQTRGTAGRGGSRATIVGVHSSVRVHGRVGMRVSVSCPAWMLLHPRQLTVAMIAGKHGTARTRPGRLADGWPRLPDVEDVRDWPWRR